MPEKSDPAKADATKHSSAARVRDNQRRARERHKAYFQDLQRKVSEYEKHGVQATLEMQQAARAVAVENERLRMLLRRKGVEDGEITAFLRDFDGMEDRDGKERKRTRANATGDGKGQGSERRASAQSSSVVQPVSVSHANVQSDGLAILADVSAQQKCCNGQTQCIDTGSKQDQALQPFTQPMVAPTGPQTPSHTTYANDLCSSTTMSCFAAAKIVADLQGHGDSERARASLGCNDEGECTIKNTALFQVMDSG